MSSRRRPAARLTLDDDFPRSLNHTDSSLDLPNPSIRAHGVSNAEDFLGHLKFLDKRRATLHPAITDYGPESLRRFIQGTIWKPRHSKQGQIVSQKQQQDQELRDLLQALVNAEHNIQLVRKEDGIYSTPTTEGPRSKESGDSFLDKGKAPVRKSQQALPPILGGIPQQRSTTATDRSTSTLSTKIHPRSSQSRKPTIGMPPVFDAQRHGLEEDGDNDVLAGSKPSKAVSLKYSRAKKTTGALFTDTEADRAITLPQAGPDISSFSAKNPESLPEMQKTPKSVVGNDSISSTRLTSSSLLFRKTQDTEVQPQFDGAHVAAPTLRQRPRASSFESHAKQSRQTQRLKVKPTESDSQVIGGSPRPRKMSASLHATLNLAAASFVPQQPAAPSPKLPDPNASPFTSSSTTEVQPVSQAESGSSAAKFASRHHCSVLTIPEPSYSISQDQTQDSVAETVSDHGDMEPGAFGGRLDPSEQDADTLATYVQEQQAIFASLIEGWNKHINNVSQQDDSDMPDFDYTRILPEHLLTDTRQAGINRRNIWQEHGLDCTSAKSLKKATLRHTGPHSIDAIHPAQESILKTSGSNGGYHWSHTGLLPSTNPAMPPFCPPSKEPKTTLPNVIWEEGVLEYLSSAEVRNLRLVCKSIAEDLEPYVFRSVVTKFGPPMFNLSLGMSQDSKIDLNASDSMLRKYGPDINKFGIAFEYDSHGLANAPFKTTETTVNAWFGRYRWPVKEYPYFPPLRKIDQILDDDRRLLTQALRRLTNCSELALSLDSGHGWLEGPDVSDLALYRQQSQGGSRVFGKTFRATDKSYKDGLRQLFRWAQINTINETIKHLTTPDGQNTEDLDRLRAIVIRDYDSFRLQTQQPDFERHLHTGGVVSDGTQNNTQNQPANPQNNNNVPHLANAFQNLFNASVNVPASLRARRQWNGLSRPQRKVIKSSSEKDKLSIQPQWPLIFSGYNLSAESRGDTNFIQSRVATPSAFPLLPGQLTEAQAQWMMETAWIQRTFLTAYTDAVRLNAQVLKTVHTLNLAKISSGLLPSLSQEAFWSALPGLRKITVLVKPDWRVEHTPGDKLYSSSMPTDPVNASLKFAELLRNCVAKLENLYTLHIGYVGGGEHQCGLYGRNQHVLPAPLTNNPREWLLAYYGAMSTPNTNSMITFNHVRDLKFENCWFSPWMLETFMSKSRDTSLHNLTLESVSLTARINSTRTDGPLQTVQNNLKCMFSPAGWLNEIVPDNASWVHVLDKVTPGCTILDHKYAAQMIDSEENPKPEPGFRGNIQRIMLKSCGYVKIQGVSSTDFNQNELVFQNSSWSAMDEGLRVRASSGFTKVTYRDVPVESNNTNSPSRRSGRPHLSQYPRLTHRRSASASSHWSSRPDDEELSKDKQVQQRQSVSQFIMISGRAGTNASDSTSQLNEGSSGRPSLTGYLTQCIHPVEKRILERCWGMKFGWGDDMRRWEAVEDGWFMGGTGRFSGDVFRNKADQAHAVAETEAELDREDFSPDHRGGGSYAGADGDTNLDASDDCHNGNDSDDPGTNDDLNDDDSIRANNNVPDGSTSVPAHHNQMALDGFDNHYLNNEDDIELRDDGAAGDDLEEY
ncbi:hypothetical protein H2198_000120 [Neophaeococcomyces mojaviensis]|uniref:Uncharacterized protein n=1 Tax=Neophaeococcomyces mojaviensis TaxID=3383035 RepID=A0ACC3ALD8_9EURO|nr:hypothetical protein H2198_000120 [Knufia sp. JES_112]